MNTMITEAAVRRLAYETGMWYSQNEKCQPGVPFYAFTEGEMDRFVESLNKLKVEAAPEAGSPVSVGQGDALRSFACEAVEYFRNRSDVVDGDYGSSSPNEEMKLLSEGEAALSARQPVGEAVDDRFPNGFADAIEYSREMEEKVSEVYELVFGYEDDGEDCGTTVLDRIIRHLTAPPAQQPAQVDLGQFRKLASDWFRLSNDRYMARKDRKLLAMYDKGLKKCSRELLALIDSQTK